MKRRIGMLVIMAAMLAAAGYTSSNATAANLGYRQYYSNWNHHPSHGYYYSQYYYKPTPTYSTYSYHYCVYRPSQPRYVYYYNPHQRHYWGRFDCEGKPGEEYSLLKPEDRKEKLEDIPEKAFPKPGPLPAIPDATDEAGTKSDGEQILAIKNLPTADEVPGDLPAPPK